jgi:1-phosphofructokinase
MTRHELDDLYSTTVSEAIVGDVLVVANPLPGDALPPDFYANLVAEARAAGTPVLVDLSSPRLDAALAGSPDLVKLNDWELAEYVTGPVDTVGEMRAGIAKLRAAGAGSVILTRGGDPAFGVRSDGVEFEIAPPRFAHGSPEGCGDSMMGGIATAWGKGEEWLDALTLGTAAGAANYLRHGLGTGLRSVIDQMLGQVRVRRLA